MFQTVFVILNNIYKKQKKKAVERQSKMYSTTKKIKYYALLIYGTLLYTGKTNCFDYFQAISTAESGHIRLHMENVHIESRTVSMA